MVEILSAAAGVEHAEPTAFGLAAPGWIALAMLAVIGVLLWKRVPAIVGGALDKKIAEIRHQLDQASQLRADAEALKAEYEAKAKQADTEAQAILAHAHLEATAITERAEADAAAVIERRARMAEDKIAAAERAALAAVRARVVDAATGAAAAIIAEQHGAAADKAIVDRTIAGLGRAN
ncbi:MAG: hypothetical protein WDN44_13910 [Sphingomonas sp.]